MLGLTRRDSSRKVNEHPKSNGFRRWTFVQMLFWQTLKLPEICKKAAADRRFDVPFDAKFVCEIRVCTSALLAVPV